ncbi:MAG: EscU/YscU/HrcU family type III secretion system export apparatus switch protein [Clostridiaceae bacterium]|nr:EscU/YscU/HrcU family type III secretion system export apparatus switch protein [Eubacteriales bacterium]
MSEREKKQRELSAAALKYDAGSNAAPRVVGLGKGHLAKKMLDAAKEHNVPMKEDEALVRSLSKLDIGQEIPVELYQAVAEVLAFLYKMDRGAMRPR